jgi:glycosyltransferase involved in cell wall biosynthesis
MSRLVVFTVVRRALLQLWRTIPRDVRSRILGTVSDWTLPKISTTRDLRPGPIVVVGGLRAMTGLGEAARLCQRALDAMGLNAAAVDITSVFRHPDTPDAPAAARPDQVPVGGTLIVHANPPHFSFALASLGRSFLRSRKVIGYWVWELPTIPTLWSRSFPHLHEIWAPSQFVAHAVRSSPTWTGQVPLRIVPYPVEVPIAGRCTRRDFGLDEHAFVVLMLFHMGSSFERKNPVAGIRAFKEAFGESREKRLVISIKDASDDPAGHRVLLDEIGSAPNISVMHDKGTKPWVNALMSCSDVVLSLHRSEGFGLVLAEGMMLGKPVIATGWSGNLDFMTRSNAFLVDFELVPARSSRYRGDVWAEPDPSQAARILVDLSGDPQLGRQVGERARREAMQFFDLERYRQTICESVGIPCSAEFESVTGGRA